MATTITNALLTSLRQHIIDVASYGRYRIGSTWYRAELDSKSIRENGSVQITFYIQGTSSGQPANRFRLCASDGTVLAEKAENVAFIQTMDTILYSFRFGVSVGQTT